MQIKKMVKTLNKKIQKLKKNLEIVVPLKHLRKFWKTLDMSLINCEINFILTWFENCVLTGIITRDANSNADPAIPAINAPIYGTFKITDTKLYVPVVTLSTEDDNKFLDQQKSGFKRTIRWNKCRSEISNHANSLIDPTFTKVNRFYILDYRFMIDFLI